jgi:uncharacterized protein YecA (UPF0149 family)
MDNLDIRSVLPMLQQFGISPDQIGPDKLEKLMKLAETIHDPLDITQEKTRQILEVLGITTRNTQNPIKRKVSKVGRNDACPCKKGKKYKHCCGSSK